MLRAKLSAVLSIVLPVTLAVLLSACSSTPDDPTAKMKPEEILEQAREEVRNFQYAQAVTLFEKLEGRAAGTSLAQQAQLEKAYAQYKDDQPAQAVSTLDRFMRLHPASPAIDYALYLKGLVNFNEDLGLFSFITRQDLSERDQLAAKESWSAFNELVTRFPDSRYSTDARARMVYIIDTLARYEVHVARYYFSRGAYVAAVNRAQQAISDYRTAPALEEALQILIASYEALNMPQLRDDARRVLVTNYPNSAYLKGGAH
ncbi:outer membrane protein assembly factor BamD [Hylemonella gracilis]|uniref:Outer membrane protein assembly factor BamD n=1 Tax=Hylemonella gracilis TaxID=80880 RepID=A0A4P6UPK0_9BURK|nr:outer membrane protein assembly factor BamD [Hylemonella gracilis]QBK05591.1 outer membrane protein assembly factor BamD [Hylemonella gracilis]